MALLNIGTAYTDNLSGVRPSGDYSGLFANYTAPTSNLSVGSNTGWQTTGSTLPALDTINPESISYSQAGAAPAAAAPGYTYANGSAASTYAQAQGSRDTVSQYQGLIDQLNAQNGRLDSQQNVGLGNIQNSYNQGENRLNQGLATAKRNYEVQDGQNMNQYSTTRTGIQNNTRATANALQRLLGMNGAGNSSAAYEQAPYAAGLQGTQNLSSAQQNYGNNQSALKMSMEDSERQFNNNFEDLRNQKFSQENGLRSSIAQTRAGILDRLREANINKGVAGGAGYAQAQAAQSGTQAQINGLLDSIAGLGRQYENPVLKTGEVAYKAPTLGQFSLGGARGIQQGSGAQTTIDPAFQSLFPTQQDDEEQQLY